ncbi:MAG: PspC domain-containing protein [Spirosomataceae bacterium]
MNRFRYFVENQIFGVCARLGEVLNFSASSIRLYFIYATFLTFGSPIIIYLVMAF